MDWRGLKKYIETEIDRNWLEEPVEMKRLRHGIVTTGAGSFNQYLSTMMFINVYTIAFGQHMFLCLFNAAMTRTYLLKF